MRYLMTHAIRPDAFKWFGKMDNRPTLVPREPFTATEDGLRWLAGFFDARGRVRIVKRGRSHQLAVQLSGTKNVLAGILEILGIRWYVQTVVPGRGQARGQIVFTGGTAYAFLEALRPYLRYKALHADLGMAFQQRLAKGMFAQGYRHGLGYRLSPAELRAREEMRMRLELMGGARRRGSAQAEKPEGV